VKCEYLKIDYHENWQRVTPINLNLWKAKRIKYLAGQNYFYF